MTHVPWRNELPLLDVHRASAFARGHQQISLAAEERGNLQHIHGLRHAGHVGSFVDVGQHGNVRSFANLAQNPQTLVEPWSAEAADRGAIRLVVRGLEDVGQLLLAGDERDGFGHLERVGFALNDARPSDEEQLSSADSYVADLERMAHAAFSASPSPAGGTTPPQSPGARADDASDSRTTP